MSELSPEAARRIAIEQVAKYYEITESEITPTFRLHGLTINAITPYLAIVSRRSIQLVSGMTVQDLIDQMLGVARPTAPGEE